MLKTLRLTAITAALLLTACSHTPESSITEADDSQLNDAADSLAWFLAESYAEYAINLMDSVPDEYARNFNPELFAEGFVSILKPEISHAGTQYGIIQGALAHNRLMSIRSCGISIDPATFMAGFEKGLHNLSPQDSTIATLDRLMAPVNRKIIAEKRRSHQLTDKN